MTHQNIYILEPESKKREITLAPEEERVYIFMNTLPFSVSETLTDFTFTLSERSKLYLWNLQFGGMNSTFHQRVHFSGEGAFSENVTLYFGESTQNFQMFVTYLHEAPACTSRIFSRGILKDEAIGRYDGMIKILQTGKKTDAFLDEKTLLLSPHAKSEAIPGLEIGTNDVKAAHSASCTRVDEAQLFYAASRGIPEEEALRMIAEGFLKSLVDKIPSKKIQKEAFRLIQQKLVSPL